MINVSDRFAAKMERLLEAVMKSPGATDAALREAASAARGVPPALCSYVEKIHMHAYRITDEDLAALARAGYTEEQIFELTVAAALGAGKHRLDAALRALAEEAP